MNKTKILLVDDQEENLLVLEGLLRDLDQNLIKAHSGEEALKFLLKEDIAVILLDVVMPGMDGFETAKLIRERDKTKFTPIIFITGINMNESHVARGYQIGAVDYIFKPYIPEILKSKVRVFVDLYQMTEKLKEQTILFQKSNQNLMHEIKMRKEIEKELKALNETLEHRVAERTAASEQRSHELARSNAELEQFAYVASHDLKEPLRMVANYCALLQKKYHSSLDNKANEYIAYAVEGSMRMDKIIEDILTFSRLGTEGQPFKVTDCDMIFESAVKNLNLMTEETQAVITQDPLPSIVVDETQFVTLFQNLINNGIKFNDQHPPRVHVSAKKSDDSLKWIFSVRDNGIGIEPQYIDQIFVMFHRLNSRDSYGGNGIGLAICKKIIERHGGRIWVESKVGEGSTFFFSVPMVSNGDRLK